MTQEFKPVSLKEAFLYWLKLGFISFGGPAGQISMMHQELVEKRRWISEQRFLHALNYCMVLPGPEAQQLATYIGWLMHGVKGGIMAGALFVLPSLILLMGLSWLYLLYGNTLILSGVLYGIKPAVTAIVLFAAWRIAKKALFHPILYGIAALAFIAIAVFAVPFPIIVIGAGIIGAVGFRFYPAIFRRKNNDLISSAPAVASLIDDHSATPRHALFQRGRLIRYLMVGVGLWVLVMALLWWNLGQQHTLTVMGWFFTKAALLTFGGAYAVLPYVVQGGVQTFAWLTATQMMDGLALGETTPGPLIMVVAFVAFVGGWNAEFLGPDAVAMAGILAAVTVTFFTFLPSFLFILVGGPIVEASRNNLRLTAPLTGITAAVVGVILNLALFFFSHVVFPNGFYQNVDLVAAVMAVLAFVLLYRFEWGLVKLIGVFAVFGVLYTVIMPLFFSN